MESKISFFNRTIYFKTLKRFFPWCICYTLILALLIPVPTALSCSSVSFSTQFDHLKSVMQLQRSLSFAVIFGIACASIFAALLIFNYLFKERPANMFHALPVSRTGLFVSHLLAGLTLLLIPVLINEGAAILAGLGMGSPLQLMLAKLLAGYALITIVFFSIAVFCCMLSAHLFMAPVLYAIFHLLSFWIGILCATLQDLFIFGSYGYSNMMTIYKPYSPIAALITFVGYNGAIHSDNITRVNSFSYDFRMIGIYLAVALLLLAVSLFLYKKRRIECAGDVLAFKNTQWIFQTLAATGTGLILVDIVLSFSSSPQLNPYITMVLFIAGAFFGFFGSKMLFSKKFFIFRKSIKGFCVFSFCALALMLCLELDVFGFERRIPQAEEVSSVNLLDDSDYRSSLSEETTIRQLILLHKQILQNKQLIERRLASDHYDNRQWISIEYHLKNGSTISREYAIPYNNDSLTDPTSMIFSYYSLVNSKEVTKTHYLGNDFQMENIVSGEFTDFSAVNADNYHTRTLSREKCLKILEAFLKDIEEGNVTWYTCFPDDDTGASSQSGSIFYTTQHTYYEQILVFDIKDKDGSYLSNDITLEASMVHTIEALKELGIVTNAAPLTELE